MLECWSLILKSPECVFRRARALYVRLTSAAAWHALKRFYSGHDLTYAASIAYWALLSLFPFLLLILSVVGAATADDADRTAVIQFVARLLSNAGGIHCTQLDAFRQTPLRLGLAGVAGLTWASLGFFGSVSTAVNYAWGVETPRSFLKHRLFAFLMLVTAGLMFLVAMIMVSAVPIIEASWFARSAAPLPGAGSAPGAGGPVDIDPAAHRRARIHLLLRAQREGALPSCVGWRGIDRVSSGGPRLPDSRGTSATCRS